MTGKASKSGFLWQGTLILLPVFLMAGFGTWAILRERNAVEQDARQRAHEILQSLPYNFFGRIASRMAFLTTQAAHESVIPEKALDLEASEKNGGVEQWGAAGNVMPGTATNILWTSLPAQAWPINFLIDENGDVWDLTDTEPPQPPAWLAELTASQQKAWSQLRDADLNRELAQKTIELAGIFLQTKPPEPARDCAEFIKLRAQSSSQSETTAVTALLAFAKNCSDVKSESGVPLSNLALAEALRRASGGTNEAALQWQVAFEVRYRPSLLTPLLLAEAAGLAATDPGFSKSLEQLRSITEARQTQRELAARLKSAGVPRTVGTVTNAWISAAGQNWFCMLQPERISTVRVIFGSGTNQLVPVQSKEFTEVIPYPETFLTRSFNESLTEAGISLPEYFGVAMELDGRPVPLPSVWSRWPDTLTNLPNSLAFADGTLAETDQPLSLPASSTMTGADKNDTEEEFDALPSHPGLAVRVVLTNRPLLYARQRQRQIIFGALIVFSVLAALVGFLAARRAFRRQLRLAEMKSNFVSSVSHELRAPIASVRLMAESLERGKVNEPQKRNEYFRFIGQECRRLSSLIENVLDFSRIEQGRKQYEFEPTDLSALTRETVKLMEPYAEEKGVVLETSNIEHRTPNIEVEVDGRAIQQALVNLIDNAIKHSAKGQAVKIGIEVSGRDVAENNLSPLASHPSLYVEDHGPGIPPAEHTKIFERFYRLGSELRRETQGVGIGLSIVKHIVEAHGGHVTVRSNVGQGSRFTIELPTNQQEQTEKTENK